MSLQPVPEVEMAGGSLAAERRAQEHGEEEQLIGPAGQKVLEGRKNVKVKCFPPYFLIVCSPFLDCSLSHFDNPPSGLF
jgi:hypothetical protein